jgi:hypothetical protein
MNALLEPALLDKKAEVVLSDGRFAEIFRVRVIHMINARSHDDFDQLLKIILQVVKLDGTMISSKELGDLYVEDFNLIAKAVSGK